MRSTGYVGIGTWSPEYPLEVETTGENAGLYVDRTDGATFKLNVTDSLAQIGSVSNHKVNFVANNSAKMTIDTNGYVGISDTTPDYPLDMGTLAPGAYCTTGGVWHSASSREYKENIRNLTAEEAMATLTELNPVRFNYKVDKEDEYVGFISEDVPELVASKDRKGMTAMDIVAVLTKVVQEQQTTISELKKEIAELKKKSQ
jgi:ribosomal protein L29